MLLENLKLSSYVFKTSLPLENRQPWYTPLESLTLVLPGPLTVSLTSGFLLAQASHWLSAHYSSLTE